MTKAFQRHFETANTVETCASVNLCAGLPKTRWFRHFSKRLWLALLLALGLAAPAAAQECAWINGFITGAGVPDLDACDGDICQWRFDYRNASAKGIYDMFNTQLEHCLGPHIVTDEGVNHPDSYDLRQYRARDGMIFVSIKDKAALQQTIVFLRAERAP